MYAFRKELGGLARSFTDNRRDHALCTFGRLYRVLGFSAIRYRGDRKLTHKGLPTSNLVVWCCGVRSETVLVGGLRRRLPGAGRRDWS